MGGACGAALVGFSVYTIIIHFTQETNTKFVSFPKYISVIYDYIKFDPAL